MLVKTNKYFGVLSLIISLCSSVLGCNKPGQDSEKAFSNAVAMPIQHFIKITYTGPMPIDTQTMISFDLENKTGDCVKFTNESNPIFVYRDDQWIKIPDNIQVSGTIIGPEGSLESHTGDVINPDYSSIPSSAYPLRMRVVVLGQLCHKGVPSIGLQGMYLGEDLRMASIIQDITGDCDPFSEIYLKSPGDWIRSHLK
jgi:hypothetical protein